jgi:hypothetical protein
MSFGSTADDEDQSASGRSPMTMAGQPGPLQVHGTVADSCNDSSDSEEQEEPLHLMKVPSLTR